MQGVPYEFVCQLRPLMFVAGLGPPEGGPQEAVDSLQQTTTFRQLNSVLRQVFTSRQGQVIYDASVPARKIEYNVILVEKNVRFPPRKARLQNGSVGQHSPISPFTPTSPLYPDGLIAPIWVRKHRDLIPSVFVLVLRLYEFGAVNEDGAADQAELDIGPLEKEKVERLRDNELVNEVINRKRTCMERGIKLAVVLLASRELLDDPTLDPRLSHIRRLSSLDSRASLFVLSPVPVDEVRSFISSLQAELYETSLDFYREHGRRLRRKRARPFSSSNVVSPTASLRTDDASGVSPVVPPRSLNSAALSVRYDFKAAIFAEFRAEVEVALKHYEDCYNALLDLFIQPTDAQQSQPFILPRTKRWAEARVLADCLNVKICKMYLYTANAAYCTLSYQNHIRKMSWISAEYWAMGTESFEYWSWESKQHRMFAELVETGMRNGFKLPQQPGPTSGPPMHAKAGSQHVPTHVMQHPGAYYLKAALDAEKRQTRFQKANDEYEDLYRKALTDPNIEEPPKISAALAHERNAPHSEQTIELYTKAYDYYKRFKRTRMTICLAYLIAGVHYKSQAFEPAGRFDRRVSPTYRRERWTLVLHSILKRGAVAAQAGGGKDIVAAPEFGETQAANSATATGTGPLVSLDVHYLLNCLLEGLSISDLGYTRQEESDFFYSAFAKLHSLPDLETTPQTLIIDDSQTPLPVRLECTFWRTSSIVDTSVPFQIQFHSEAFQNSCFDNITFESIEAYFNDDRDLIVITEAEDASYPLLFSRSTKVPSGSRLREALCSGAVTGYIRSADVRSITLSKASIKLKIGNQHVTLQLHPASRASQRSAPIWLAPPNDSTNPESLDSYSASHLSRECTFERQKLKIDVKTSSTSPAYLGEELPISISIRNLDHQAISLRLGALVQPSVRDSTGSDSLRLYSVQSEKESKSKPGTTDSLLVEQLQPGDFFEATAYLTCENLPGERILDLDIVAKLIVEEAEAASSTVTEVTRQLVVEVIHPFFCDWHQQWRHPLPADGPSSAPSKHGIGSFLDLKPQEPFESAQRLTLSATLGAFGPTSVMVHQIALQLQDEGTSAKVLSNSISQENDLGVWDSAEPVGISFLILVDPVQASQQQGTLDITWSRSDAAEEPRKSVTTRIPICQLLPPPDMTEPQVIASCPTSVYLHKAFKVSYALECPAQWGPAPIEVTFQLDSASDNFVLSGPRKVQHRLILHQPQSSPYGLAVFTFIPIGGTGLVNLPQFRCWQIMETPLQHQQRLQALEQSSSDAEDDAARNYEEEERNVRTKELKVIKAGSSVPNYHDSERPELVDRITPLAVFVFPR